MPKARRWVDHSAAPPREEQPGRVYLILAGRMIKIGFTATDPKLRITAMQTGNPEPMQLLGSIKGTRSDEQALHKRYARNHVRGEWYALEEADVAHILEGGA